MDFEIYHDESKEAGYWHGIFLVPVKKKQELLKLLEYARNVIGHKKCLSLKKIKKKNRIYFCARAWIQIGVASMIHNLKGMNYPIIVKEKYPQVEKINLEKEIATKFILFREKDNLKKMNSALDHGAKVETTFRMGLKGGLHFLGDIQNPINIVKLHFDGHEHYKRQVDKDRIIGRLKGLRDYVTFDKDLEIDDRKCDHNRNGAQHYDDCQLLQLTDLLIGSYRTILGESKRKIHNEVAFPVNELIKRYNDGYKRMQNSRWVNSFCMSQCYLDNDQWQFENFSYPHNPDLEQLPLL